MSGEGIDTQAALTISAAVVALATLIKWGVPGDRVSGTGALAIVIGLSCLGVFLWVFSLPQPPTRQWAFGIFQAIISVSLSAAGIYGFSNATTRAVGSRNTMPSDPEPEPKPEPPPHPLAGMPPRRGPQCP